MKRAMLRWELTLRLTAACVVFAAALSQLTLARAEPPAGPASAASDEPAGPRPSVDEICRTLAQAAADNDLPEEFFTRLIWQESRFNSGAVSPAGAQGIAQFMPQTAAIRGLANAFEPLQALRKSASYLRELRTTFRGSLGLAAAAYNAGPAQVEAWLAGRRSLPFETQAYVRIVTGYAAEAWTLQPPPQFESGDHAILEPANRRALRRTRQADDREFAPSPRSHLQPGLGAVGCPACRQLVRRRCPRRLRTAAPQVRCRSGRPVAAGPVRAPRCGRDVHRPGLGKEPGGRGRAVCEAAGGGRRLHRRPQPAWLECRLDGVRCRHPCLYEFTALAGVARPRGIDYQSRCLCSLRLEA